MSVTDLAWFLQNRHWDKVDAALTLNPDLATEFSQRGGYTLLHKCADRDEPQVLALVDQLLAVGADVNARDFSQAGMTPLHVACSEKGYAPRNPALVERLLAAGADPNAQTLTSRDVEHYRKTRTLRFTGLAPLHFALREQGSELIKLLLRYGASPTLHTPEQDCGSAIDSCRRGEWKRHLPALAGALKSVPSRVTLSLQALDADAPAAYLCTCRFVDPAARERGDAALPPVELGPIEGPKVDETRGLVADLAVPLAADGLPCNLELAVRGGGDPWQVESGTYVGKPIQYTPAELSVSVVNLNAGEAVGHRLRMGRGLGPFTFDSGLTAHRLLLGLQAD